MSFYPIHGCQGTKETHYIGCQPELSLEKDIMSEHDYWDI